MRLAVAALLMTGCVRNTVENFTLTVVDRAMAAPDVDRVCQIGAAMGAPLAAATSTKRPARKALLIADTTAGLCDEERARQAELDGLIAASTLEGAARVGAVKDAREKERRYRQQAALRFYSAWNHTQEEWGALGETCPKVKEKDGVAFVVGLVSGTLAMLHDKASGSHNGVPLDTLSKAGRAARCLDSERWWALPEALEASAWLTVPGSGPDGVDPWEQLEEAAKRGESSGVRLGWGLAVMLASNTGEEERLEAYIPAAAEAFAAHPQNPAWRMLDAQARAIVLHESDLLWANERGHRTIEFGALPVEPPTPEPAGVDPFAEDPFAPDPVVPDPDPEPEETP